MTEPGSGDAAEPRSRLDLDVPPEPRSEAPEDEEETEPRPARRSRRMKTILILPSLITLGSTFCGILAIAYVADAAATAAASTDAAIAGAYEIFGRAGLLIFLAMIFDALDGRVARLSHVTTEFGGQLDSLSDAISFGVAPAVIAKGLVELHYPGINPKITLLLSALFVICAVLRLARYNVEHDNLVTGLDYFTGLPSPGAAGIVAAIAVLSGRYRADAGPAIQALPYLTPVLAILMISRFPYIHAMNRFLRGRKPFTYLVVIVFVVVFGLLLGIELAVALILAGYLLSGPIGYVVARLRGKGGADEGPLFD